MITVERVKLRSNKDGRSWIRYYINGRLMTPLRAKKKFFMTKKEGDFTMTIKRKTLEID
jgi:hypothetical protein